MGEDKGAPYVIEGAEGIDTVGEDKGAPYVIEGAEGIDAVGGGPGVEMDVAMNADMGAAFVGDRVIDDTGVIEGP